MNLADPGPWPTWNSLQEHQPPLFQEVLVYRSAIAHRGREIIPEDRGVNRYDIDRYTGLPDYPWLQQGGCLYFRFAAIPPPNHRVWNDPMDLPLPHDFSEIALVILNRSGHHAGTFLAKSIEGEGGWQPHIYVPKRGFIPLNNTQILRWVIAPRPPKLTEREQKLEQAMRGQNQLVAQVS